MRRNRRYRNNIGTDKITEKHAAGDQFGVMKLEIAELVDYYTVQNGGSIEEVRQDAVDALDCGLEEIADWFLNNRNNSGRRGDSSIGTKEVEILGDFSDYDEEAQEFLYDSCNDYDGRLETLVESTIEFSVSTGAHWPGDYVLRVSDRELRQP